MREGGLPKTEAICDRAVDVTCGRVTCNYCTSRTQSVFTLTQINSQSQRLAPRLGRHVGRTAAHGSGATCRQRGRDQRWSNISSGGDELRQIGWAVGTRPRAGMLPALNLALAGLCLDDVGVRTDPPTATPAKRKAGAPSTHYGLASDSSVSVRLVVLSRLVKVRDEQLLVPAAAGPIGIALLAALREAVRRVAIAVGGAAPTLHEQSVATFFSLSASTVATRRLYDGGLSLPTALPWGRAKALLAALLESLGRVQTTSDGTTVATLLLQLPSPPLDAAAQAAVSTLVSAVEAETMRRLSGEGASSSGASGRSTPPPPQPAPVELPVVLATPFAVDASASLGTNVQRLISSSLNRQLDATEAAAIDAAIEEALSLLQAGGADQRRALVATNVLVALTSAPAAQLWACAVDAAENAATSTDAFASAMIDGCSAVAAVLFTTALGF